MVINPVIGDTDKARALARILGQHSHLDAQSCLAITVLLELIELGHAGDDLAEALDHAMRVHATEVLTERLAARESHL